MRTVAGSGGVPLAVYTDGPVSAPPVLLVHGYPDTHRVWDAVTADLAADHFVIRYDVRGAGASGAPQRIADYRLPHLAADLFAVLTDTADGRPVHVVGHDWGSVQAWEAVCAPQAPGRIASFTTISGPCLDHVGHLRRSRGFSLKQATRSWYIGAFHVPVVPSLVWRAAAPLWPRYLRRAERVASVDVAPTLVADAVHGMSLYRANVLPRMRDPQDRRTELPVLQVELQHDPFVTGDILADVERWAPQLRRRPLRSGHWVQLSHPDLLAGMIREQVAG